MAIDVVVVDYKRPDLLCEFIESYHSNTFEGCKLFVFEVASKGSSFVDKMDVDLHLQSEDNVGYGAACNGAAALGTNDVILLANADTYITSGSLKAAYEALTSHVAWGVLGPLQYDERGWITSAGVFGPPDRPRLQGWREPNDGRYRQIQDDALNVSGSLYFIKRSVWNELTHCDLYRQVSPIARGPLLETRHYYEETWCSYHARAHGYKVVFDGEIQMVHYWHQASEIGGWADQQMNQAREQFRRACQVHGLVCE